MELWENLSFWNEQDNVIVERREGSEKEFSFQYNIHLIRMQYVVIKGEDLNVIIPTSE